jgi:hypothetical protein
MQLNPAGGMELRIDPSGARGGLTNLRKYAAFFHEATHIHGDDVYGSIVTMPKGGIGAEAAFGNEERERVASAAAIRGSLMSVIDDASKPLKKRQLMGSLIAHIDYGRKGDFTASGYAARAIKGFRASKELAAAEDGRYDEEISALETLQATRERISELEAADEASMVEFDPSINDMLMWYELSTKDRSSRVYRQLKAAALASHVKRHNAQLAKDLLQAQARP